MKLTIKRKIEDKVGPSEIIDLLLKDRSITDKKLFIHPIHPKNISLRDFFEKKPYLQQRDKVFKLLSDIHARGEMVVVYTDYDADGITGGAILWQTLAALGFHVMPYVPNRKTEGYGFSRFGIDTVIQKYKPAVIISVDHGIVAHDEVLYAQTQGIPVIITDHHQRFGIDPEAFAIFHTDQLSGAGVAYFFAKEIFEHLKSSTTHNELLTTNFENDFLALAAIGTIADMVPLLGPARSVTKYGLSAFSQLTKPGLHSLVQQAGLMGKTIGTYEVGFMIAPRINAFGRIGDPVDGLRLLCATRSSAAQALAKKASVTNTQRQVLVTEALQKTEGLVDVSQKILVVVLDDSEEGIIGLIASKLTEKYSRPSIVITKINSHTKAKSDLAKASARSIPGFDITSFLRGLKKYLINVGGHAGAAGFTMQTVKIEAFIEAVQKKAKTQLTENDFEKTLMVDLHTPLPAATIQLVHALEELAPFGIGNPTPLFLSSGSVQGIRLVGTDGKHVRLVLRDPSGYSLPMIYFNGGKDFFSLVNGQSVQVAFHLEQDTWMGRQKLQGRAKTIQSL